MKKVYYLSTCSTCKRIMSELDLTDFEQQDIKSQSITSVQLEEIIATGTPEDVAKNEASFTGHYLAPLLTRKAPSAKKKK